MPVIVTTNLLPVVKHFLVIKGCNLPGRSHSGVVNFSVTLFRQTADDDQLEFSRSMTERLNHPGSLGGMLCQSFVIVAGTPHLRQDRQLHILLCNPAKSLLQFRQIPVYPTECDIEATFSFSSTEAPLRTRFYWHRDSNKKVEVLLIINLLQRPGKCGMTCPDSLDRPDETMLSHVAF
jgi:hypothetical protein